MDVNRSDVLRVAIQLGFREAAPSKANCWTRSMHTEDQMIVVNIFISRRNLRSL